MHLVRCLSVAAARFGRLSLFLALFASISPLLAAETESDNTQPAEPNTGSVETSSADPVVDGQGTQIDGAAIYRAKCAECHGAQGEGRADRHDEPLHGDRSLASLAEVISE